MIGQLLKENEQLRREIARLANCPITRIAGRAVFERVLETEFARARRRKGRRLAALMIDVDHFKKVNDEHGPRIGDVVLRAVAQTIREFARASDTLPRYGGDEFVLLVEGASELELAIMAERIRAGVQTHSKGCAGLMVWGCPSVTISVGTALLKADDESPWAMIERADAALYRAKRRGRKRIAQG